MTEDALKEAAQKALSSISVPGKTDIVEIDFDEFKFHALLRVGNGRGDKEDQLIERWWKEVITTLLYQSAGESWNLHICVEYRIGKTGELGYIWNFIFSSPDGIASSLPDVADLIESVSTSASLRRVDVDRIRVGPPDRNKARGQTRFGKPSMKGVEITTGRAT